VVSSLQGLAIGAASVEYVTRCVRARYPAQFYIPADVTLQKKAFKTHHDQLGQPKNNHRNRKLDFLRM